jgi:hypothetical protein
MPALTISARGCPAMAAASKAARQAVPFLARRRVGAAACARRPATPPSAVLSTSSPTPVMATPPAPARPTREAVLCRRLATAKGGADEAGAAAHSGAVTSLLVLVDQGEGMGGDVRDAARRRVQVA